jgi:formate dehydrogenase iron-sulfur subunit
VGAIAISVSHLGRPLYAFRAFLGLRRSWLSREIVAFGLWASLALFAAGGLVIGALGPSEGSLFALVAKAAASPAMRASLILAALLVVHCSAMVYRDTPRALWATRLTSAKFLLSAAVSGIGMFLALSTPFAASFPAAWPEPLVAAFPALRFAMCAALPFLIAAKLACESRVLRHIDDQENNPLKKAALLLRGELRAPHALRFNAAVVGGMLLPILWLYRGFGTGAADIALGVSVAALVFAGECLERYLFFTTSVPPRMPGS